MVVRIQTVKHSVSIEGAEPWSSTLAVLSLFRICSDASLPAHRFQDVL